MMIKKKQMTYINRILITLIAMTNEPTPNAVKRKIYLFYISNNTSYTKGWCGQ